MITSVFLKYALVLLCFPDKYHNIDATVFLVQHSVLVSVAGPPTLQYISTLQSGMWLQPT